MRNLHCQNKREALKGMLPNTYISSSLPTCSDSDSSGLREQGAAGKMQHCNPVMEMKAGKSVESLSIRFLSDY